MHYYKLDDKKMDAVFLKGLPVICKAVVPYDEYASGKVSEGTRIVVVLSNRKKFMGRIIGFTCAVRDSFATGDLEVIREQST